MKTICGARWVLEMHRLKGRIYTQVHGGSLLSRDLPIGGVQPNFHCLSRRLVYIILFVFIDETVVWLGIIQQMILAAAHVH
jgi:hypothetical protein